MAGNEKLYLSDVEAATVLGIKVSTLRKWRLVDGRGPKFRRLGRKLVRYSYSDLVLWLESQPTGGQN
jgi:hypothetical protein